MLGSAAAFVASWTPRPIAGKGCQRGSHVDHASGTRARRPAQVPLVSPWEGAAGSRADALHLPAKTDVFGGAAQPSGSLLTVEGADTNKSKPKRKNRNRSRKKKSPTTVAALSETAEDAKTEAKLDMPVVSTGRAKNQTPHNPGGSGRKTPPTSHRGAAAPAMQPSGGREVAKHNQSPAARNTDDLRAAVAKRNVVMEDNPGGGAPAALDDTALSTLGARTAMPELPVFELHMRYPLSQQKAAASQPEPDAVDTTLLTRIQAYLRPLDGGVGRSAASGQGAPTRKAATRTGEDASSLAIQALRELCDRRDRPKGLPPPRRAFDIALEVCAQCKRWDMSMEALGLMQRSGVVPHAGTYKAILRAYSGPPEEHFPFIVQVLAAMPKAGVAPDLEVLEMATMSCLELNQTGAALHFLRQAQRVGHIPTEPMFRESIIATSRRGQWQVARELLDESRAALNEEPETVCCTMVIKALGKSRQWRAAVGVLEGMLQAKARGSRPQSWPNVQTYLAAITACSSVGQWQKAVELLRGMRAAGVEPTIVAFNVAISGCDKAKKASAALELLDEAEEMGLVPDLVTYNTAISACGKVAEWTRALAILSVMKDRGVKPDLITYNSVMQACANAAGRASGAEKRALKLLDEMRRFGIPPDVYSYTSAITACSRAGSAEQALRLLEVMKDSGVHRDVVVFTAAIDACAQEGRWKQALDLLDEMRLANLSPNERTYRAAIGACGKGGQWQRALELLNYMRSQGYQLNRIVYNSAIAACENGSQWQRAMDLMHQMSSEGVQPDLITYSTVISACGHAGMWKEALDLLEEMRKLGPATRPNVITYTSAITACGRAGEWQRAVDLLSAMQREGLSPDRVAFNAVINACRRSGQTRKAMDLLASMVSEHGILPDDITVTELVAALSEHGEQEEAYRLYALAVKAGSIKSQGLDSAMEIDVSGLAPTVAKVKIQHVLTELRERYRASLAAGQQGLPAGASDLTFVTGTGAQKAFDGAARTFDQRQYLVDYLRTEYRPSLHAHIPARLQGCVVVPQQKLLAWLEQNQGNSSPSA